MNRIEKYKLYEKYEKSSRFNLEKQVRAICINLKKRLGFFRLEDIYTVVHDCALYGDCFINCSDDVYINTLPDGECDGERWWFGLKMPPVS